MTDHFIDIYTHRAAEYHRMITPEDVDGNLPLALERVTPLAGKRIVDLGSGTGRLPILLAGQATQMICLDLHAAMLHEQWQQRQKLGGQWGIVRGDMRTLPLPNSWAQVVLAGWAIGHLVGWYQKMWRIQIAQVLREMERITAPGGAIIIMETLGTGSLTPAPPTKGLANYYAWLENEWGFNRQEIQTDYQFAGSDEAVARTRFFFGDSLAAKVQANNWTRLPEWTGVWGKVT